MPRRALTSDVADRSGPMSLTARCWWRALRRTVHEFRADKLTDWAAALTYYAVLSTFPTLIVLVALLGLLGQHPQTTNALLDIVDKLGPRSTVDTLRGPIEGVIKNKGGAGALLGFGLIGALWSASGYVGAFMRASNAIYDVKEDRPFWKLRPLQIVLTVAMVLLLGVVAMALVVTGGLAQAIGDEIGLEHAAVTAWSIAKWPALLVLVMGIFAALYYVAPNVRQPGFRWITPGGALGVLLWILASAGFALYVSNLGSYNKTYGSLGAVIVFLVWLWISNIALLLGAEFNAVLQRSREPEAGGTEGETPFSSRSTAL
jgi:membrane protein